MVADDKGAGSQLVKALIAAKKAFKPLLKNKVNPHFRNGYADLTAVHDAVDDALAANGLTIMQPMKVGPTSHVILTKLCHVSGEAEVSEYALPGGVKSQDLGSAITYGRRYSLCALLGISHDEPDADDDGNAASGHAKPEDQKQPDKSAKADPKPAKVDKKVVSWTGNVAKVNNVANGKWMIIGADTPPSEFGTSTPEHASVAADSIGKCRVKIAYMVNQNGIKVTQALEPEVKNG
jgi:hypothetical protein